MKARFLLVPLALASPLTAATIDLGASNDTDIRDGRSYLVNGSTDNTDYRFDFTAYFQFDMSSLGIITITSAALTLTQAGGDTLVTGRIRIVGMDNAAGNTPQNWDEFSLSYDTTGDEANPDLIYVPGPPVAGDSPFDFTRVTDFEGGTPGIDETAGGGVGGISGDALAAWLETRRKDGGLATFIVDFPATASDKQVRYASRENLTLNPPTLSLSFEVIPVITQIEWLAGPSVKLTWTGVENRSYTVERTDVGLETPDWVAVSPALAGAALNTFTDDSPTAATAFYRVVAGPALPIFLDTFDGADMGWTAGDNGTTSWDLGTPINGPEAAQSAPNCYVTNIEADYGPNADVSLLSPVIDLTTVTDASLNFDQFLDVEGDTFDYGEVYARDAAGQEIVGLEAPLAIYNPFIASTEWEPVSIVLPAAAQSRTVTFEFRFVSDSGTEFSGWYIDNVSVTTP